MQQVPVADGILTSVSQQRRGHRGAETESVDPRVFPKAHNVGIWSDAAVKQPPPINTNETEGKGRKKRSRELS